MATSDDDRREERIAALERRSGGRQVIQDGDQREAEIERRTQERVAQFLDHGASGLPDMIGEAVERAMRRVLSDQELSRQFWERGYEQLSVHASNNASQWIGKRLLTAIILAATTAGLVWLVKTGNLK